MNQIELAAKRTFAEHLVDRREQAMLYTRRRWYNAGALAAGDTVALSIALLTAGVLRFWWLGEPVVPVWSWYMLPAWWGGAAMMRLLPGWGLGPVEELRRMTVLLLLFFALTTVVLFLSKQAELTSRLTLTVACGISLVAVPLTRLQVKRLLIARGSWGLPTAIYGAGATARKVVELLRREEGLGYRPVAVFDDNPDAWGERLQNVPVLGGTDLVTARAPVAILAMPSLPRKKQVALLEGPLSCYRTVLIIPDLFEAPSLWVKPRDLNGILGLEIASNLMNPSARFLKRATDVVLILATAPFWLPLCALLAALIWLEDGASPFFTQERVGRDSRLFRTWKFRTMLPDAEQVLLQKLSEDEALRQEWETTYKLRIDPRVTRIGRFLRRFSLDELPQLWNVLQGEMSLVGPRPLPRYHHNDLADRVRELRERVRPGMTGLWQVSGRSDAGTEGMEQWDPYYVRNWSLWLDVVVLVRTWRAVVFSQGAY